MKYQSRLRKVEELIPDPSEITVVVVIGGSDEEAMAERVKLARARGNRIKAIRVGVQAAAESQDEADALIETHRSEYPAAPITVCSASSGATPEVFAEWDPGLPQWMAHEPVE